MKLIPLLLGPNHAFHLFSHHELCRTWQYLGQLHHWLKASVTVERWEKKRRTAHCSAVDLHRSALYRDWVLQEEINSTSTLIKSRTMSGEEGGLQCHSWTSPLWQATLSRLRQFLKDKMQKSACTINFTSPQTLTLSPNFYNLKKSERQTFLREKVTASLISFLVLRNHIVLGPG